MNRCSLLLLTFLHAGPVCATQPELLRGTFGSHRIVLATDFGTIPVATQVIERIAPHEDGRRVLLGLRNGDQVIGIPTSPTYTLVTGDTQIEIPFHQAGGITLRDREGKLIVCTYGKATAEQLARDLQIHLTFDGDGQTVANQTKRTAPATLVQGRRTNDVVSLDGRGDHLLLANHESFELLDQLTISIWVNLNSFAPGGYANEHGYLVNKGNDMWWNPAWCLGYSKGSGAGKGANPGPLPALFVIGTEKSGGRATCRLGSRTKLETKRWYHLVGTYDGKQAVFYVNGRLENVLSYTGKIRRDAAPLLLGGGSLQGTGFRNHFTTDACIDNLRIYSRALRPGEVGLLHRLESSPPAD